jgi:hypothetical protein
MKQFYYTTLNCKNLFLGILLVFINFSFAQTNTPISIRWNSEVGCQIYGNDRDNDKPVFIEDITDSDCIKICDGSKITFTLDNLPTGSTTQ